jgi:hypothetical protein
MAILAVNIIGNEHEVISASALTFSTIQIDPLRRELDLNG